jgi:hypothetical protein
MYGKEDPTPSRIVEEKESWVTTSVKMLPSVNLLMSDSTKMS